MAGSFSKKGGGPGASKRPVPTIEGTATEVTVEPEEKESAAASEDTSAKSEDKDEASAPEESATDDDAAPPSPEASEETPRTRPSRMGVVLASLTAGLLGGLVGAGALAIAWNYLPASEPADLSPLEDRIAKLESAPAPQDNDAALTALDERLAALEDQEPKTPAEVESLADRVAALEASLKAMAEAAKEGGSVADAAAITQQINEAEKRLQAKIDAALTDAEAANAAALDALQKDVAALGARLKALAEAELNTADGTALGPELQDIDERLAKLEEVVPAIIGELDKDAGDAKAATLAIAFANLRAAVDEGRPYAAELATLAALSPGAGDLGGLLDYEDTGIPTVPKLTRSFKAAKDAALAQPAADADGSLLDRLLASAASLVKIRRVDADAEGDTPDAVLARAEAKLGEDDLAAAAKEVETLQGGQRAAFAAWLDQAKARLGAEATLRRLQDILLVSIGGNGAADETGAPDETGTQE